ncbi:MAG: GxxExxY protein [Burkholderiales bacterium]|nr:GxxExxY protein [Burkholderiales bacterium]
MKVHSAPGPGLPESAYEACLCRELALSGLAFRRQVPLIVSYEGLHLDCAYRLDLVIEEKVIAELKCVEDLLPIHHARLLTYLRLSGKRGGLLVNFNVAHLRDGTRRVIAQSAPNVLPLPIDFLCALCVL